MNKLLRITLLVLIAGLSACEKAQKPNIILFLVDDMGWQDTSVPFWHERTAFNKLYRTPGMERLAKQGLKFTQAYSHSVCSPTRVSLMSGMHPARHRVTNWTLRRNASNDQQHATLEMPLWNMNGMQQTDSIENSIHVTTLPQILKDNGYFNIHCGKAHFGAISTPGENPLNLGFDVNIAGHAAGGLGSFHGENNYSAVWRNGSPVWDVPGLEKYHGTNTYLTEALTREALLALDSVLEMRQPFFLYMSHYAVHAPIEADHRFVQKYLATGMDSTEASYASMVESMDRSLSDILDFVEEKDLNENTIILFTSDNGGLSAVARGGIPHTHNKPLSSGKGSAHEGGIREPMLVSWPGVTNPGTQTDHYLLIEDFFPTILEMAQVSSYETVQTLDGQSFTSLLRGEAFESADRALFWHFPNNWGPTGPGIGASSSIRKGDWKLIYYHADQAFELFNIREDIGETANLEASNAEMRDALAKELGEYLRSVDAQMPTFKESGEEVPWPDEVL